jgi:hypothetical protein
MPANLLELVTRELLPTIAPLGFRVAESEQANVFDNASVVLESPALRIRVIRERGIVVLDLGPTTHPNSWFDSAVVIEYLGLSDDAGFHDRHVHDVLHGVGVFIRSMWVELQREFAEPQLAATTQALTILRQQRATRLFGR